MINAYTFRAPFGVVGDISRPSQNTVEAQASNASLPFPSFGVPGKMASGLFVPVAVVGDTAPYGFLVRPLPTIGANASDPLGTAVPIQIAGILNVLRRGYIFVHCNAGTPAANGTVYIRYASGATATPVGGIEAASVGSTTVALTNAVFMGPADANGIVEIGFNI